MGLAASGRRGATAVAFPDPPTGPGSTSTSSSVVVATGGARGVTAACLLELCRRAQPRLAILGRTPLQREPDTLAGVPDSELRQALVAAARGRGETPTPAQVAAEERRLLAAREVRRNLASFEDAGATVRYLEVDVARPGGGGGGARRGAGRVGPGARRRPRRRGHRRPAPGRHRRRPFERVFTTKVEGLRALLEATAGDPLRVICLFSSVAGRTGNTGQGGYAMANEILNKVAASERRRRGAGCLVKVVGWGPWEGGMVTPDLAARFAARGVPLIPLADGARALVRGALRQPPRAGRGVSVAGNARRPGRASPRHSPSR